MPETGTTAGKVARPPAKRARGSRGSSNGERPVDGVSEALGARIRHERRLANLTVRELAARVGLSPSLISQIELARATPSVATLWAIAGELGLSVADLFNSAESASSPRGSRRPAPLQPHATRSRITLASGIRWERLTTEADKDVDFLYVEYPVGAASTEEDALMTHGGREFGYVLSGTLGVKIGFDEFLVGPNDSISFDSTMPHRLWAVGNKPARAIWIVINRGGDARAKSFE
jgi:transcriptional regulator with XRE-family HTH domain